MFHQVTHMHQFQELIRCQSQDSQNSLPKETYKESLAEVDYLIVVTYLDFMINNQSEMSLSTNQVSQVSLVIIVRSRNHKKKLKLINALFQPDSLPLMKSLVKAVEFTGPI